MSVTIVIRGNLIRKIGYKNIKSDHLWKNPHFPNAVSLPYTFPICFKGLGAFFYKTLLNLFLSLSPHTLTPSSPQYPLPHTFTKRKFFFLFPPPPSPPSLFRIALFTFLYYGDFTDAPHGKISEKDDN